MKILIVEDQKYPLQALEFAVNSVFPNVEEYGYDVANCYYAAKERVLSQDYDVVLLDHRMPYMDQGDLEDREFNQFSNSLENIGYLLIPTIKEKNSNTVVIGTSSLGKEELNEIPLPDFNLDKSGLNTELELESILKQAKLF